MLVKYFERPSEDDQVKITNLGKFLGAGCALSVNAQNAWNLISTHGKESPDNSSISRTLEQLADLLATIKTDAENMLNIVNINKQALNNQVVKIDE